MVRLGDCKTISHADAIYGTQVVAVSGKCVTTTPVGQPSDKQCRITVHHEIIYMFTVICVIIVCRLTFSLTE